jgi:hypothetical protein
MRMQMFVWASGQFRLPVDLPESDKWQKQGDTAWSFAENDWQVTLEPETDHLASAEVLNINSDYQSSIRLTLEPITAEVGFHFLDAIANAVAKKCGGCLIEGPMGLVSLDADGKQYT